MLQIFCSRAPSQKLSKLVPKRGLPAKRRATLQTSVRPVRVGSLPIALSALPPTSRNKTDVDESSAAMTNACTDARVLRTARWLVTSISVVARENESSDVMELACQKSHITIARRTP